MIFIYALNDICNRLLWDKVDQKETEKYHKTKHIKISREVVNNTT